MMKRLGSTLAWLCIVALPCLPNLRVARAAEGDIAPTHWWLLIEATPVASQIALELVEGRVVDAPLPQRQGVKIRPRRFEAQVYDAKGQLRARHPMSDPTLRHVPEAPHHHRKGAFYLRIAPQPRGRVVLCQWAQDTCRPLGTLLLPSEP